MVSTFLYILFRIALNKIGTLSLSLIIDCSGLYPMVERAVMNYRPMLDGERFMTDKELCARLQLSRRTLQDY